MIDGAGQGEEEAQAGDPIPNPSPWRRGIRGIVFCVGAAVLVFTAFERCVVLRELQRDAIDFQAEMRSALDTTSLVVVEITEDDYASMFGASSPLDADVLAQLIAAIRSGAPRAIGVDIATDDSSFRDLGETFGKPDERPVVWARELVAAGESPLEYRCGGPGRLGLRPFAASGRQGGRYGMVRIRPDPDGLIRRYERYAECGDTLVLAFPLALLRAAGVGIDLKPDSAAREYLVYYQRPPGTATVDASVVMEAARRPDFGKRGLLQHKIVLLGGTYRAARDAYLTPLTTGSGDEATRYMAGVQILAQIARTEAARKGSEPLRRGWIWFLLFLDGLFLLSIFLLLPFPTAFWVSLVVAPLVVLVSSWIVDQPPWGIWPYVVPILLAVLVDQLYDHAIRYRNALVREKGPPLLRRLAFWRPTPGE